eukprot:CAMPEP_0169153548 /NCGR_PEP_ID=MMETSP1015-20121227/52184_1 /TAXON_ID=342587 /ORGANISM="Karlodinium micrum, Strain CCMP2283" /LENGTH=40 /DNA_ID= /DNA_START= /DNA_END= /DNA_ORIENTATION=
MKGTSIQSQLIFDGASSSNMTSVWKSAFVRLRRALDIKAP